MINDQIERWLLIYLAVLVGEPSDQIDPRARFAIYDLDSFDAIEMAMKFQQAFGVVVEPELFMDGSQSIESLCAVLSGLPQV